MKGSPSFKAPLHLLSVSLLILLALLTAGCASAQTPAASVGAIPEVDAPSQEYIQEHGYPTNAAGQTYGPLMRDDYYGPDPEYDRDDMPDLLLVTSSEGLAGYVYWDELLGSEPGSIDEALERSSGGPRELPVYTEDGTTVIGTFTVQ